MGIRTCIEYKSDKHHKKIESMNIGNRKININYGDTFFINQTYLLFLMNLTLNVHSSSFLARNEHINITKSKIKEMNSVLKTKMEQQVIAYVEENIKNVTMIYLIRAYINEILSYKYGNFYVMCANGVIKPERYYIINIIYVKQKKIILTNTKLKIWIYEGYLK